MKAARFNTNPKFKEVTLNSFIFVIDIFCTNPARKFAFTDITYEACSFCLLHFVNTISQVAS